jgi:hypothetical protein
MGLPTSMEPAAVDRYLAKIKDAALHMRMLHAQFHYDSKLALSRKDIEAATGRCAGWEALAGCWAALLGGRVALLLCKPGHRQRVFCMHMQTTVQTQAGCCIDTHAFYCSCVQAARAGAALRLGPRQRGAGQEEEEEAPAATVP